MSANDTKAWRTGLRWFSEKGPHEYGFGVPTAHGEVIVTFRAKEGMSEEEARMLQSMLESVPALKTEMAEVKRDLHAEMLGSDASHRLLTELGVERDSGPDEMPPGAVLNVTERIRRLDAKHGRQMAGAKQAVDAVRNIQAQAETRVAELERRLNKRAVDELALERLNTRAVTAESERDALRAQVVDLRAILTEYMAVDGSQGLYSAMRLGAVQERARAALSAETTPAPNSPEIPDGSPSDADFVTVRNTLAGSPGAADYNDAFNALLRLSLKAGKWDAALARADDGKAQHQAAHDAWGSDPIGGAVQWVLHGDDAKETP